MGFDWLTQLAASLGFKTVSVAKLPVTIPVAIVAVFLCFFMVPSTRKLSLFAPALIGTALVGYLTNAVGVSYNWPQGLTVTVAAFAGFFTLAGLMIFAKVHERLLVDDNLVDAVMSLILNFLKKIGGSNDKSA